MLSVYKLVQIVGKFGTGILHDRSFAGGAAKGFLLPCQKQAKIAFDYISPLIGCLVGFLVFLISFDVFAMLEKFRDAQMGP